MIQEGLCEEKNSPSLCRTATIGVGVGNHLFTGLVPFGKVVWWELPQSEADIQSSLFLLSGAASSWNLPLQFTD